MAGVVEELKKKHSDLKNREIEGILYLIKTTPLLTNNDLIRLTGLPKETLRTVKNSISNMLISGNDEEITLNEYGKVTLQETDLRAYKWALVEYSDVALEQKLGEIRKKYYMEPKREFDQFFATVNTSVAKAAVLRDRDLISGKNIALLGDDDLISITLGLMDSTYNKITVFDIDPQILEKIAKIAGDLKLKNIETRIYDARTAVKKEFAYQYDIVMTDPPYTASGISLFLIFIKFSFL